MAATNRARKKKFGGAENVGNSWWKCSPKKKKKRTPSAANDRLTRQKSDGRIRDGWRYQFGHRQAYYRIRYANLISAAAAWLFWPYRLAMPGIASSSFGSGRGRAASAGECVYQKEAKKKSDFDQHRFNVDSQERASEREEEE